MITCFKQAGKSFGLILTLIKLVLLQTRLCHEYSMKLNIVQCTGILVIRIQETQNKNHDIDTFFVWNCDLLCVKKRHPS